MSRVRVPPQPPSEKNSPNLLGLFVMFCIFEAGGFVKSGRFKKRGVVVERKDSFPVLFGKRNHRVV